MVGHVIFLLKKIKYLFIWQALLLAFSVHASNTDSLIQSLKTMRADTNKVYALFSLATGFAPADSARALAYADEMQALAKRINFKKGVAQSWLAIGQVKYFSSSFKHAIYFFEKSAAAYKEINQVKGITVAYLWLSRCCRRTADYAQYGKCLSLFLQYARILNEPEFISYAYEGYGNLYRYLGDYPNSIKNYTQAIEISEKAGRPHDVAVALNNLSLVYGLLGQTKDELRIELRNYKIILGLKDSANMVLCLSNLAGLYQGMDKTDTAQKCIDLAMRIIQLKGADNINFKDVASVYGQFSNFAAAKNDFKTAVEFQNKNINLSKDNGDIKTVAGAYSSLADIFILMGNKTFAEEYFLKSLEIHKSIGLLAGQIGNYESLEKLYLAQKKQQKADSCKFHYTFLKDSLLAMTNERKLAEAQTLYKINEQRQEILQQSRDQKLKELEIKRIERISSFITGAFILFTLGGLFYFFRRKKK